MKEYFEFMKGLLCVVMIFSICAIHGLAVCFLLVLAAFKPEIGVPSVLGYIFLLANCVFFLSPFLNSPGDPKRSVIDAKEKVRA
jgi:hypothetical protein